MDYSAKILLLGKTGVGKSSFINYFLGKEVAKTGKGKPITMDYFVPYEVNDGNYPVKIYDTKGLETLGAHEQLNEIIDGIKKQNNSDDIFDWFHTIFYCVSMNIPRFEDFEANFIRKLQQDLTQHIHIIITHCDACGEENIRHMRERILNSFEDKSNIEIFEVVCISKKKRGGKIAQPYGKEAISERVFDLLLKDIARKISSDYAVTLNEALTEVANNTRLEAEQFIDEVVRIKTLIEFIKDADKAYYRINDYLDTTFDKFEEKLKYVQEDTDRKFNKILQPIIRLYISYKGVVTNSIMDDMELNFENILEWSCEDWMESNENLSDESYLMQKVCPIMAKNGYLKDGELCIDGDNPIELLKVILSGIRDLWNLDDVLKKLCREIYHDFVDSIPKKSELQQEAYKRIVNFMKLL